MMSEMISVKAAAERWNITERRVSALCKDGKIAGAMKQGNRWMIPADTQKPAETALQQINEKKYDAELTAAGVKTIYKYGVAFSGKKVEVAVG